MVPRLGIDEAVARYWGTYGFGGKVLFDEVERRLVHKDDVLNLLPRHGLESLREHPGWRVARDTEIGFDPTEADPQIRCNLFGGWPTEPNAGDCSKLLGLLELLCDGEPNGTDIYQWVLRWLAYPLQHRGAKMQTAVVVHGPQGTGKSLFFESYAKIFGEYARVLGQEAIEDKFNADWAEKKLFILADEVLARADLYHIKNRLKGFITGDTIRVNPKNVAAHNEKNQMNIVFLTNERQPLVLEHDDRRHCVIWAPPAPGKAYFDAVMDELRNGGVAALHHYLLAPGPGRLPRRCQSAHVRVQGRPDPAERVQRGPFRPRMAEPPVHGSRQDRAPLLSRASGPTFTAPISSGATAPASADGGPRTSSATATSSTGGWPASLSAPGPASRTAPTATGRWWSQIRSRWSGPSWSAPPAHRRA